MQWTQSQSDAIISRDGTVLVSAAAGSGKTAVLVQRAIERLTDPEKPTPANRMLIVTFTKAAAAEMRARLEQRLMQLMRQRPEDRLLRRQSVLMHQAHIGTVDSFCAEMAREFFHLLELTPDFKILSDKRQEEMMSGALEEAVSAAFEEGWVQALANAFTGERDDRRLGKMVLTLYNFMQSHPFPARWLQEKVDMYSYPWVRQDQPSPWERVILDYTAGAAEYCGELLDRGMELAREDQQLQEAFCGLLASDKQSCMSISEAARAGDWDAAGQRLRGVAWARQKSVKGWDKEDPALARLQDCRKRVKDMIKSLGGLFVVDREECGQELQAAAPLLESLRDLTLDFSRRYDERKRELGFLDYSDLEHCAVKLFCNEDGSPTPAALEVSGRFDEIMIDEYQDVNEVQDSIFRAVSRRGGNLFMVGDVKQSIYGFRRAMPEIFLRCREAYEKYDRLRRNHPSYIVLERNFRSRREVTDTVNFVFSRLMSREGADIEYTGEERLVCGADYPEKEGCGTELCFISREGVSAETAEAQFIARRIKELIAEGFTITSHGEERPAAWGDFCILLRSANKPGHIYAKELNRLGVPARASVSGGFFSAAEVQVMLSLLRVIDNPNQDIPLLAVLMSPLYGFSADDAARLRANGRDVSVYVSLTRAAEAEQAGDFSARCQTVLEELGRLRSLSATMPADGFLTMLYGRTGYTDMALAMEDGAARLENLRLLRRYAGEYESSGYHGLSGFVRFLDRLRDSGSELQAAEQQHAGRDHVKIMSIHKSKGLQFPVCIVAGCGHNFPGDRGEGVLLHPELGLGVRLKDPVLGASFTTAAREAIALENARSAGAEELRILYVAMTRAQEKLILVASGKDMNATLERAALELTGEKVSPFALRRARSYADWLMACAIRHPDGRELRGLCGLHDVDPVEEDYSPWRISLTEYVPEEQEERQEEQLPAPPDMELYSRLRAQAERIYPFEESLDIPAKVSASKLSGEQGGSRELSLSRPAWLGRQGMTPAQRGIALHDFMQFADFHRALEDPAGEISRLEAMHLITPEQAGAIELHRIRAFFRDSLGKRVLRSPEVLKERRFTAAIPSGMAQPEPVAGGPEEVILQGSVDCTFMENGKLHIIDFKTDRVEDMEELWRRYEVQIRLYAYAMEQVTGEQVGELLLYSTWLSRSSGRMYDGFRLEA